MALIVGIDGVVDGVFGLVGVEFAGIAVFVASVVVVDAVGDVACLLYLGQEVACTDGVDASGGEEVGLSGSGVVGGDDVHDGVVGHTTFVFVGSYGCVEAGIDSGVGVGVDDVPHFGFAG